MVKLAVGTKVRMSDVGKKRYMNSTSNPHLGHGVVISCSDYRCSVKWSNGERNSYHHEDLVATEELRGVAKFLKELDKRDGVVRTRTVKEVETVEVSPKPSLTQYTTTTPW